MAVQIPRSRRQQRKLASAQDTPAETLITLARHAHEDPEVLSAVASHQNTPLIALARLSKELPSDVRRYIGSSLDPEIGARVIGSDDPVATALARSGEAADERDRTADLEALLLLLTHHGSDSVRGHVARHAAAPESSLSVLSRDPHLDVRLEVAGNPNSPSWVLSDLSKTGTDAVRSAVAANPGTPGSALEELARAGFESDVAGNPGAPAKLIKELARDALEAPDVDWSAPGDAERGQRLRATLDALGANPATPPKILDKLAHFGCEVAVASNPQAPKDVLDDLFKAHQKDPDVMQHVAQHPNARRKVLRQLATESMWPEVRDAASKNLLAREERDAAKAAAAQENPGLPGASSPIG